MQKLISQKLITTKINLIKVENKDPLYCRKDCIKKLCESFTEHEKNIIDSENKKMLLLTKEELKSYQDAEV